MSITVRSFSELQRAIAALEREMQRDMRNAVRRAARYGVREIGKTSRETTPRPYAFGLYERGWKVEPTKYGADIVNPVRHAIFVEQGRAPGKQPPLGPLRRWVMQKRMAIRPSLADKIAFVIARRIARKGVKGRFVLDRSMPRISARLARNIELVIAKHADNPPRS